MGRLVIVSNRLPVTVAPDGDGVAVTRSMGGLATGMKGPHERLGGVWIGWPGDVEGLSRRARRGGPAPRGARARPRHPHA